MYVCMCELGVSVKYKTVNIPLLLTIKDYRDSIDYRDIFRAAIVIVNFLLSPSTNCYMTTFNDVDSKPTMEPLTVTTASTSWLM